MPAFEDRCCAFSQLPKLHVWQADENTGRLAEMPDTPVILSGPFEYWPTVTPDNTYFYAAKPIPLFSEIGILAVDSRGVPQGRALASASTESFPSFDAMLVHPGGRLVYGWGWRQMPPDTVRTAIHAYHFNPATNTFSDLDLSSKMPESAIAPLTFDRRGKHFYFNQTGTDHPLLLYNVDQQTGDLTFVSREPMP